MTHTQLREEIKSAMKAREEVRLSVLRGLLTACTNELVAKGKKPTDELAEDDVMALVRRAAKQRKDSIDQFEKGGRADLAEKEKVELAILEAMLPVQMSREEIGAAAKAKAAELGFDASKKNQLMGALMKDLKGKADGSLVKEVVDALFS
ncbi:MAG: GatB/YqeY domain-containing protein [Minisyncoccia bacterium]